MKLTVHIGHYKTGSTAIQTHFDTHRAAYRRRGFLYPSQGKPLRTKANHSGLAYQELHAAGQPIGRWYPRTKEFKKYKSGERAPARQQIIEEVRKKKPDHVLISSEEFILFGGRRGVPARTTKALLAEFGAESIHVICYLRRPDRYLESWYNQRIKLGAAPLRLSEGLDRYLGSVHVQYFDAVSYWANLADQTTVLRYDDARSNLVGTTLGIVGVPDITRLERRSEPDTDPNPRIPDAFVEFARVFNQDRRPKAARRLRPVLTRLARDREIAETPITILDANARKQLLETFRPIDRQLASLAGTGDSFFADLDEMLDVDPNAISDIEAYDRWGMLAFNAMRDDFDDAHRRKMSTEPDID